MKGTSGGTMSKKGDMTMDHFIVRNPQAKTPSLSSAGNGAGSPGALIPKKRKVSVEISVLEVEESETPPVTPSSGMDDAPLEIVASLPERPSWLTTLGTPTPSQAENMVKQVTDNASRVQRARYLCMTYPRLATHVLDSQSAARDGWCRLSRLASNQKGYVQLSIWGANKFALAHHVICWASGQSVEGEGMDGSHLCPNTKCLSIGHCTPEPTTDNQGRKNCARWAWCHCGCGKAILICRHEPPCIKYASGYSSWEDFLANGLCAKLDGDTFVKVVS